MSEFKDYSGKKVLYIDDSSGNLMAGMAALGNYKLEVHTGRNMAELFERVKENTYDLIILDDMMPENRISGTDAMKKLRAGGYSKPIVVLTANTSSGDITFYLKAGFNEHLSKPINIEELDKILNQFLN